MLVHRRGQCCVGIVKYHNESLFGVLLFVSMACPFCSIDDVYDLH